METVNALLLTQASSVKHVIINHSIHNLFLRNNLSELFCTVIGGCMSTPCQNGGTCNQFNGNCQCLSGYTGQYCQTCNYKK